MEYRTGSRERESGAKVRSEGAERECKLGAGNRE